MSSSSQTKNFSSRIIRKIHRIFRRLISYPLFAFHYIHGRTRGVYCTVCGRKSVSSKRRIISDELAASWELSSKWRNWYDEREGTHCPLCMNSRRTQYMASTLLRFANEILGVSCTCIKDLARHPRFHTWSVAELNSCGQLHRWLAGHPNLAYSEYKAVPPVRSEDLLNLSYPDQCFDLILTSETLEHVPDVPRVLSEIKRVLKPGGTHLFTIPVEWDRPRSRTRARIDANGELELILPPSYHGCAGTTSSDMIAFTEFGADVIEQLEQAGFIVQIDRSSINPSLCTFITTRPVEASLKQDLKPATNFRGDKKHLLSDVINGGYCIGCGACALVAPSSYSIQLDKYGCYQAVTSPTPDQKEDLNAEAVCPFSNVSSSEDELSLDSLPACTDELTGVGRYIANYAGYVTEPGYRDRGSSGGMVSWIANELLRTGHVDGIIHIKASREDGKLFEYGISRSTEELCRNAKSKYYPVELSTVLADIEKLAGTYAIIALPCFAKALRNLMRLRPVFREKIRYVIGLFCGHLKSARYAENYGWQLGIPAENLESVDFRVKLPGNTANHYGIEVKGRTPEGPVIIQSENEKMFGTNWGFGFFKYGACDYCDDVTAELADISIGDAWLKPYLSDADGNNIVVVRNRVVQQLVEAGITDGRLKMDAVTGKDVYTSQASGLRHRREGLSWRLYLKQNQKKWAPPKRVLPSCDMSIKRRGIYRMRMQLSEASHQAYEEAQQVNSYAVFQQHMEKLIDRYLDYYASGPLHLIRRKIKRGMRLILGEKRTQSLISALKTGKTL